MSQWRIFWQERFGRVNSWNGCAGSRQAVSGLSRLQDGDMPLSGARASLIDIRRKPRVVFLRSGIRDSISPGLLEQVEETVFVVRENLEPVQLLLQFIRSGAVIAGIHEKLLEFLFVAGIEARGRILRF